MTEYEPLHILHGGRGKILNEKGTPSNRAKLTHTLYHFCMSRASPSSQSQANILLQARLFCQYYPLQVRPTPNHQLFFLYFFSLLHLYALLSSLKSSIYLVLDFWKPGTEGVHKFGTQVDNTKQLDFIIPQVLEIHAIQC